MHDGVIHMTPRKMIWFATALVMVIAIVSAAAGVGQGPRGGRGGPSPGGPGARAATVEHVMVHGKALEGNLEGDPPDRNVTVYLPPVYATDQARRFPVVYFLHDYGAHSDGPIDAIKAIADRLAGAQGFSAAIVVVPDAHTLHQGSLYSSSATTGEWERFISEDLVTYIDGHYRTLAKPISRGLAGYSMGGYGALRIAMKRPGVFSSLYIMSACCLAASNTAPETMLPASPASRQYLTDAEAIRTREQAEQASGPGASVALAAAAAWSPNPNNPPLFLDLPVKDGKVRPDVVAKWTANAPLSMLDQYAANLKKFYAIAIDVGTNDAFLPSNQQLHQAMMRLHIPHYYEEYEGDHANRLSDRFERNLLFFSKNLAAPANPTSPGVQD
jgi:enterochelin esterase-like enzyme